jgi:hypothetical protein
MTASSPEAAPTNSAPVGSAFSEICRVEIDGQLLRVARRKVDGGTIRPLLIFNGIWGQSRTARALRRGA